MNVFINNKREFIYLYLLLINTITFLSFISDKSRAKKRKWRIPEGRLLFLAFLGGSLGGLIGMLMARHKTKNLKFTLGMPIILVINIISWFYLIQMAVDL